ncbi:MAG: hypothetical protein IJ859_07805 [Synergistaceae bacterium]|nr:hypothetical protein [Synergistaceae bacterium]
MDMGIIVSKFGSSAMANAERIKKTAEIIKSDPRRQYVVVSAPGRINPEEIQIKDLLYILYSKYEARENFQDTLTDIQARFEEIVNELGVNFNISGEIAELNKTLLFGKTRDIIVSRGEYIIAKILAAYLGWTFMDAAKLFFFNNDGSLNEAQTFTAISQNLSRTPNVVVPGGYGALEGNRILMTNARGDAAGAVIARVLGASLYEKWTDHRGIYIADPTLVEDAQKVRNMTYAELVELSYMGITAVHEEAILKLQDSGVPLNVLNIYHPEDKGTLVSMELPEGIERKVAACISGRKTYKIVRIHKMGLNKMHGVGEKVFNIFSRRGISCEHYISGIYNFAVVLKNPMFDLKREEIIKDITTAINPEKITVDRDLALIAIVGTGMGTVKGIFARIFDAVADAGVKVQLINQGADSLNIIIGVRDEDFEKTIKALYNAMILD